VLEGDYIFYSSVKTLTVISCADASIVVSPSTVTTPHYKFIGTANALFTFPVFTSDSTRCPVTQYDISSSPNPTFTQHSNINTPITFTPAAALTTTDVTVTPSPDARTDQHIQLYVRASAFYEAPKTIGVTAWSPVLVDFYIGCGSWVTITPPPGYSTTSHFTFS
jgi:hypothetical protein